MAILPSGGLRTSYPIVLSSALVLSLSACGGGSSGGSSGTTTVQTPTTITGVVSDPAIANAKVRIDSADGKALAPVVVTDSQGKFTLTVPVGTSPSGATISATSGTDAETGYDFKGLTLKAPYESDSAVVSPLTTMVVDEMKDGADLAAAKKNVAERFGVAEDKVMVDPTTDATAQKASLQLTKLAAALRAAQGFDKVADLTQTHKKDWAAINTAVQADPAVSSSAKSDVQTLASELEVIEAVKDVANAQAMLEEANRLSLLVSMRAYLKSALQYEPVADSTGDKNVIKLVEAIWTANEKKGIPSGSSKVVNLVRYALNKYDISTANLDNADWAFPAALASDTQIKSIASLSVIDHTIALNDDELLGDDSAKRREYFHQSDLSPIYQAQKLVEDVLDDNVVDPINKEIAVGLSNLGFKEDADVYLQTQIFQPAEKADAYLRVAIGLRKQNKKVEGKPYLDKSLSIKNEDLSVSGSEIDSDIALFYQVLSFEYGALGLTDEARDALKPVNDYIEKQKGKEYETAYGRIAIAFRDVATKKVEAAEASKLSVVSVVEAMDAVKFFSNLVDGVGYQSSSRIACGNFYRLKGSLYTDVAELYRRLDKVTETEASINKFVQLRANDSCTSERTDSYVEDLADEYAYLDKIDEFRSMVNSTVLDEDEKNDSLNAASIYTSIDLAKSGKVDEALKMIESSKPDSSANSLYERLELYTHEGGINRLQTGLGLALLKEGNITAGRQVLNKALSLVTSDTYINAFANDGFKVMRFGCAKIALLTYDYITQAEGIKQMEQCVTLADRYTQVATSLDRNESYRHASEALFRMQQSNAAIENYRKSLIYAAQLDVDDYLTEFGKTMTALIGIPKYESQSARAIERGLSIDELLITLSDAEARININKTFVTDENTRRKVASQATKIASIYNEMVRSLRASSMFTGEVPLNLDKYTADIRSRSENIIVDVIPIIREISSSYWRKSYYTSAVSALNKARAYDASLNIIKSEPSEKLVDKDKNDFLGNVATSMMSRNDFAMIETQNRLFGAVVARFDFDNDGKADFYEIGATQEAINDSKIQLDDDIDADGELDTVDKTPFCKACAG